MNLDTPGSYSLYFSNHSLNVSPRERAENCCGSRVHLCPLQRQNDLTIYLPLKIPVVLNITQISLKNAQVSLLRLALNNSNGFACFGDFVSLHQFRLLRFGGFARFGSFVLLSWVLLHAHKKRGTISLEG